MEFITIASFEGFTQCDCVLWSGSLYRMAAVARSKTCAGDTAAACCDIRAIRPTPNGSWLNRSFRRESAAVASGRVVAREVDIWTKVRALIHRGFFGA